MATFLAAVLFLAQTPAAAEPAKEPSWKTEFREAYGLKEGESIRRVAPPYPECRAVYFSEQIREHYRKIKREVPEEAVKQDYSKYFTKFGWKDGWTVNQLTMHQVPVVPEVGAMLGQVIHMTTGFNRTRIDAWEAVLSQKVTGDFVVRAAAPPEQIAGALEKILREECNLAVSIKVVEEERDMYVVSGKYEAAPLSERTKTQIEIYAFDLGDRTTGGGGSGTLQEMANHVEGFIDAPITLGEIVDAPRNVEWHFNHRSKATDFQRARDRDAEAVMENIATQTGLTVKLEKRKIKVLVVEETE